MDIRVAVDQLNIHAMVDWVNDIEDPVDAAVAATVLVDRVRDQLLPELAAVRRIKTVMARQKLTNEGMRATDATRELAAKMGMSPQTINRMYTERRAYGYQDGGGDD